MNKRKTATTTTKTYRQQQHTLTHTQTHTSSTAFPLNFETHKMKRNVSKIDFILFKTFNRFCARSFLFISFSTHLLIFFHYFFDGIFFKLSLNGKKERMYSMASHTLHLHIFRCIHIPIYPSTPHTYTW